MRSKWWWFATCLLLVACGGSGEPAPAPGPAVQFELTVTSADLNQDLTPFRSEDATVLRIDPNSPSTQSFLYHAVFPSSISGKVRELVVLLPPESAFVIGKRFEVRALEPMVFAGITIRPAPYDPTDLPDFGWGGDLQTGHVECVRTEARRLTYQLNINLPPGISGDDTTLVGQFTVDYAQL